MQINWARLDEPMRGTDILDKSWQRIWFLTKLSDITGSVQVAVLERIALALFTCTGKEEFIQAHEAGQLQFPLFHNVRLTTRKNKRPVLLSLGPRMSPTCWRRCAPSGGVERMRRMPAGVMSQMELRGLRCC